MKILFIVPNTLDSCSFYRSAGIAPDLCRKLNAEYKVSTLDRESFSWDKLIAYDVVMFQRPFSGNTLQMIIYLKQLGIPVWVDFDDYTLGVPFSNSAFDTLSKAKENIILMARLADVISVTTPALAKQLSEYNTNIHVIPNAFNDTLLGRKNKAARTKNILWRGGESHMADLMVYSPALNLLMEEYKEHTWVFYGTKSWMLSTPHQNVMYLEPTDPMYYFDNISRIASPLIHVPLEDIPFNHCKSNIAFIEGAYCGSVCIAPDWEEWQKPGVITYKNVDDYYRVIKDVLNGKHDTRELAEASWNYITENLLLSDVNELRVKLIWSLISRGKSKSK